jgi:DNA-binding XRE family transcriptional regulator
MTPDKLIEILKQYQRESNQSERTLAARIGVNHHTVNRWLKDAQCPMKGTLALAASFLRRVGYL